MKEKKEYPEFYVVEIDGVLFPAIDQPLNWNFQETKHCYEENPYKMGFHTEDE